VKVAKDHKQQKKPTVYVLFLVYCTFRKGQKEKLETKRRKKWPRNDRKKGGKWTFAT
jgi:hypothetical protein